jgi:hypothetical protein
MKVVFDDGHLLDSSLMPFLKLGFFFCSFSPSFLYLSRRMAVIGCINKSWMGCFIPFTESHAQERSKFGGHASWWEFEIKIVGQDEDGQSGL